MIQPSREEKKIASVCTYAGCEVPAGEASEECPYHHKRTKARKRKYDRKRRARYARRKLCVTCGRRRRGQARHCAGCLIRLGRLKKSGADKGADKRLQISARTIVDKEGRTRYLGQSRRGAPSVGQLDEWDLALGRKEGAHADEGHAHYQSAEVQAMPRIQREDIRQAYASRAFAAARAYLLVCKRAGWTVPGLNDGDDGDDEIAASPRKSGR